MEENRFEYKIIGWLSPQRPKSLISKGLKFCAYAFALPLCDLRFFTGLKGVVVHCVILCIICVYHYRVLYLQVFQQGLRREEPFGKFRNCGVA